MERRRAIGPKRTKNTPALVKAVILAAVIAIIGSVLAYYLSKLIGSPPEQIVKDDPDQKSSVSLIYHLPGILQVATVMAALIVLFLGSRAYMMGQKARHSILTSRKKLKRTK